jgi:hypothetical protein
MTKHQLVLDVAGVIITTCSSCSGWTFPLPLAWIRRRLSIIFGKKYGKPYGLEKPVRQIYVDDQEKNLVPARDLGWETILAD